MGRAWLAFPPLDFEASGTWDQVGHSSTLGKQRVIEAMGARRGFAPDVVQATCEMRGTRTNTDKAPRGRRLKAHQQKLPKEDEKTE